MSKRWSSAEAIGRSRDSRPATDAPETGPFLFTFTARLPFVLGIHDGLDHEVNLEQTYANDDGLVFGRSPFVRVRLFNATLADRKFAAANLASAIEHFYNSDIGDDAGGENRHEQWVTLETPAVLLKDESHSDPAYAFHRSMSALGTFLEALAIARSKDWVRPVSTRELRPVVVVGRLDLSGKWQYSGPMLMHPDAKPSPAMSQNVADHAKELNEALDLVIHEAPFLRTRQWLARAERRRYEGDATDAILSYQVAAETMLFELWGLMLLEEGSSPATVAKKREDQPFRGLLSSQLSPRLGGSWDHNLGSQPVGRYWSGLYELRNRVIHAGYQPHDGDAEAAEQAYAGLERFVDERLNTKGKCYPATLIARQGKGSEKLLARLDAQGDADAAGLLGESLKQSGKHSLAEAAFRRSQDRGSLAASVSLGKLLIEKGDTAGAEAAWRRADSGGNAEGAANLGSLLYREHADLAGAEAAWRRADHRGSPEGALNLGILLADGGDRDGAQAAWDRADDRGNAEAAFQLGELWFGRGDHDAAQEAWARADQRGSAIGALRIGLQAQSSGDAVTAEEAFRRADERGSAEGAVALAHMMEKQGKLDTAEELYARAADRGSPEAAFNLGVILHKGGRPAEAESAYRGAAARGFAKAIYNLGVLNLERGDIEQAMELLQPLVDSDDPDLSTRARDALADRDE